MRFFLFVTESSSQTDEDSNLNVLSEEERFVKNIPRLYYGFFRLIKCILHPGLLEYIAATYFKKELKHVRENSKHKGGPKNEYSKVVGQQVEDEEESVDLAGLNHLLSDPHKWSRDILNEWDQKLPNSRSTSKQRETKTANKHPFNIKSDNVGFTPSRQIKTNVQQTSHKHDVVRKHPTSDSDTLVPTHSSTPNSSNTNST